MEVVVVKKAIAQIEWDKEKALKDAQEFMAKYDGLQIQESDLPQAKKDIASLRKVSKEINSQALAIDKELTEPVKQFRSEVKEVKAVVDSGITFINNQVKEFEAQAKEARKQDIMLMEEFKDIEEFVPFNDEWLLKKWNDNKLIELFNQHKEQLITYKSSINTTAETLNLDATFYINKLKTTPYVDVIQSMNDAVQGSKREVKTTYVPDEDDKVLTITRVITGTKAQLKALKKYALEIGCEYGA